MVARTFSVKMEMVLVRWRNNNSTEYDGKEHYVPLKKLVQKDAQVGDNVTVKWIRKVWNGILVSRDKLQKGKKITTKTLKQKPKKEHEKDVKVCKKKEETKSGKIICVGPTFLSSDSKKRIFKARSPKVPIKKERSNKMCGSVDVEELQNSEAETSSSDISPKPMIRKCKRGYIWYSPPSDADDKKDARTQKQHHRGPARKLFNDEPNNSYSFDRSPDTSPNTVVFKQRKSKGYSQLYQPNNDKSAFYTPNLKSPLKDKLESPISTPNLKLPLKVRHLTPVCTPKLASKVMHKSVATPSIKTPSKVKRPTPVRPPKLNSVSKVTIGEQERSTVKDEIKDYSSAVKDVLESKKWMLMHERGPQALTRALFKQLFTHQELLTATFSGKAGKAFDKNRLNIIQKTVFTTFDIPICIQTALWSECRSSAIQMLKYLKHGSKPTKENVSNKPSKENASKMSTSN